MVSLVTCLSLLHASDKADGLSHFSEIFRPESSGMESPQWDSPLSLLSVLISGELSRMLFSSDGWMEVSGAITSSEILS